MVRHLFLAAFVLALVVGAVSVAAVRTRRDDSLPYSVVRYSAADAQAAFASHGIRLALRSRVAGITDFANARDVIEVTVFGAPDVVRRGGFRDLEHGRDCTVGRHLALHWRGNVRAIVNCDLVRDDRAWIARIDRALDELG